MRATWNGIIIAESDETIIVEGNHYFPPTAINQTYLKSSQHQTICPWKGKASYYDIVVGGDTNADAAWTYHQPKEAASHIKDHVAFWRGVRVEP